MRRRYCLIKSIDFPFAKAHVDSILRQTMTPEFNSSPYQYIKIHCDVHELYVTLFCIHSIPWSTCLSNSQVRRSASVKVIKSMIWHCNLPRTLSSLIYIDAWHDFPQDMKSWAILSHFGKKYIYTRLRARLLRPVRPLSSPLIYYRQLPALCLQCPNEREGRPTSHFPRIAA